MLTNHHVKDMWPFSVNAALQRDTKSDRAFHLCSLPCPLAGCMILFRLLLCPAAFLSQQALLSFQVLGISAGGFPPLWHSGSVDILLLSNTPFPAPCMLPAWPGLHPGKVSRALLPRMSQPLPALAPHNSSASTKIKGRGALFLAPFFGYLFKRKMTYIDGKTASKQIHQMPSITGLTVLKDLTTQLYSLSCPVAHSVP